MPDPLTRCPEGHFYDPLKQSSCPWCAPLEVGLSAAPPALPVEQPLPPPVPADSIKDVNHVNPVVGWLVCMEGPDKGRDFRLQAERNFIGRSPGMEVCVPSDNTISREKHAAVLFDPKRCSFWVTPGHGTGLVYLNGHIVHAAEQMHAEDVIELGATKLLLVPFCGEKHAWEKTPA